MKYFYIILLLTLLLPEKIFSQQRRRFAPDFIVGQYAGSIGFISAGAGYDIFKSKSRFSLHFGSVPGARGGPLNILSTKLFFEPLVRPIWSNMDVNLLDVGLMFSYHFGNDFKLSVPEYFSSDNYYWWHTALRAHLAIESSFTVRFKQFGVVKGFNGYVELNTNDLYLVSYIKNTSSLKITDIIKIGIGSRLLF